MRVNQRETCHSKIKLTNKKGNTEINVVCCVGSVEIQIEI